MRSKEALEYLKKDYEYYRKKLGYSEYFPIREQIEYETILKDLEVLELLKSQFTIEKAQFWNDKDIYFKGVYIGTIEHEDNDDKELLKIEEWLDEKEN